MEEDSKSEASELSDCDLEQDLKGDEPEFDDL
jgi:hypothetical protein